MKKKVFASLAAAAMAAGIATGISDMNEEQVYYESPAVEYVLDRIDENFTVLIGEVHHEPSAERRFFASLMPYLKEHGIKKIAIEIDFNNQQMIDTYLKTGIVQNPEKWFFREKDLFSILQEAREHGIEVLCMDDIRYTRLDRIKADYEMFKKVKAEILDKGEKTLILTGAWHLVENSDRLGGRLEHLLGASYAIVLHENNADYFEGMQQFYKEFSTINLDSSRIGSYVGPKGICPTTMSACYDGLIFLPNVEIPKEQ